MSNTKFKQTEIGEIPEDWKLTTISSFFDVKNGKSDVIDADPDGEFLFFDRSSNIKKSKKYLFDSKAVIIPGEGKEFNPRYYEGKFDLHQRAYAITPNGGSTLFDIRYLFYWIVAKKKWLSQIAVGSTVKSLRMGMLTSFPLVEPAFYEQQQIASILSSLDDKIELNRRMNKTLEEMGKALFKRWFVDFEFPFDFAQGKPNLNGEP